MRSILSPLGAVARAASFRMLQTSAMRIFSVSALSGFSGSTTVGSEQKSTLSSEAPRKTGKNILSRKTFLVDFYKHMNDTNDILLYVHHNNMVKADTLRIRSDLQRLGVQLLFLRNGIYKVYLRSSEEENPALAEATQKNKHVKHPLSVLLNGPTAVIAIKECNPRVVESVMKVLKSANDKLMLMGARVETAVYTASQVDQFKSLPTKEELQAQLAGLLAYLGGAGLVRTLESNGTALYLTLEQRSKDMDPLEKSEES